MEKALKQLEQAVVVPGSETPAPDGLSGAVRCVLSFPDGSRRAGVLKRIPPGQVAAEAFSALVLRAWGLPVPDPFIVSEPAGIAFASADLAYPNLKQRVGFSALPPGKAKNAAERMARELALKLPSTALAAAADEAIDNRDRNLGNILWDGAQEAWIDHAFSLGQGSHLADRNILCDIAVQAGDAGRLQQGVVGHALAVDRGAPAAVEAVVDASLGPQRLASFVATRVSGLAVRLLARFPPHPGGLPFGA